MSRFAVILAGALGLCSSGSGAPADMSRAKAAIAGAPDFGSINSMSTMKDTVVPYQTDAPPETGYHHSTFDDEINTGVRGSGSEADWALQQIEGSYANRPTVNLDISDSVFDTSKQAMTHAGLTAGHIFSGGLEYCTPTETASSITQTEICEVFPVPEPMTCERRRDVEIMPINRYRCDIVVNFFNQDNYCEPLAQSGVCTEITSTCVSSPSLFGCLHTEVTYDCGAFPSDPPDPVPGHRVLSYASHIEDDQIIDTCEPYRTDPRCTYDTVTSNAPGGTRLINGVSVYRDWWHTEYQYQCNFGTSFQNGCASFEQNPNCTLESAFCLDANCGHVSRAYECTLPGDTLRTTSCNTTPVCVGDVCLSAPVETDSDFALAASWLNVLDGMAEDVAELNTTDPNDVRFFSGESDSCTKSIARNCCDVSGVLRDLIPCSQSQKDLAVKRDALHTVYTGSECADRVLGTCIRTKSNFCTFETKFARVFQEQIREQQGRDFGSTGSPKCDGLTITDLESADLGTLDLSELFGDSLSEASVPVQSDIIDFMTSVLGR